MIKAGGTLAILGVFLYVFAVLADWSYHGGPASWSPKLYRAQKMLGIAVTASAAIVVFLGLIFR